jgi:RNA polymerase sigma-70 factor, ECF subfamily
MPAAAASAQQIDRALMLRVRANDTAAFGELYDRYVRIALRVAHSVCHDASRAEEAVQEGFLSVWQGRGRYRPESGSVKGWVLTIVRHRAIDAVRRDASASSPELVELTGPPPDTGSPSTPDAAIAQDEGAALRAFMARLPDAQSEVITLAFFGGLTHTEIAEQLSLPPGTVKGRMRLGMHKLRSDMEQRAAAAAPSRP